jgi:F0F1-type ATP synthase assembly protein I
MGKAAKRSRKTTAVETDPTQDYLAVIEAKQRFISTVMNMGWRLAVTFLVPVIFGAWLDRRFDSSPSYTLTGMIIAVIGSVMVVSNTVKEVNEETAAEDKLTKKKRKNAKTV